MTRTPPPSDRMPSPPPSPPPPLPDGPSKNPWRINPSAAAAAAAGGRGVTPSAALMGEPPSSWPPLSSCSQRRGADSPPLSSSPEIQHPAEPSVADFHSSAPWSEIVSSEETLSLMESPALHTPASSPPPPPVSSGNAAAPEQPWSPPRPPSSPHRRGGRSHRFNNQRGGGGGGGHRNHQHHNNNGGYSNRPMAPGWRPNWGFNALPPQYPPWGFYPGAAVRFVPPGDVNPYYVPYAQPYGEMIYPDFNVEQYAPYFDPGAYEMQYVAPIGPGMTTSLLPTPVSPSFAGVGTQNHQEEKVEDKLIYQIEYYFSDGNLVKDTYLRYLMDSEGWVDIHKVASFKRVAALTEDINLIMDVLKSSNVVELQGNKMRRRHEWDKWILKQSSENSLLTSMQIVKLEDNLRS